MSVSQEIRSRGKKSGCCVNTLAGYHRWASKDDVTRRQSVEHLSIFYSHFLSISFSSTSLASAGWRNGVKASNTQCKRDLIPSSNNNFNQDSSQAGSHHSPQASPASDLLGSSSRSLPAFQVLNSLSRLGLHLSPQGSNRNLLASNRSKRSPPASSRTPPSDELRLPRRRCHQSHRSTRMLSSRVYLVRRTTPVAS